MNVPRPVPLVELKKGELYFKENILELLSFISIVKIEKIQLTGIYDTEKKKIICSKIMVRNYSVFSNIFKFKWKSGYYSIKCNFFKNYIQFKDCLDKIYFYNFDEEWFLKNKEVLLSQMNFSILDRPFQEVFKK